MQAISYLLAKEVKQFFCFCFKGHGWLMKPTSLERDCRRGGGISGASPD
jgi:hypothetical protein